MLENLDRWPPIDPALEKLQLEVVKDRDLAKRGKLKLGALSDGYFEVVIDSRADRVVVYMPPLRAGRLGPTRRLIAKRYRSAPVSLRLAPRVRLRVLIDPRTGPKRGEPLSCRPGSTWNAKRIIGRPLARARRMALRHDCTVREVYVNGMALPTTRDYRPNRLNVAIRAGRVTHILGRS